MKGPHSRPTDASCKAWSAALPSPATPTAHVAGSCCQRAIGQLIQERHRRKSSNSRPTNGQRSGSGTVADDAVRMRGRRPSPQAQMVGPTPSGDWLPSVVGGSQALIASERRDGRAVPCHGAPELHAMGAGGSTQNSSSRLRITLTSCPGSRSWSALPDAGAGSGW